MMPATGMIYCSADAICTVAEPPRMRLMGDRMLDRACRASEPAVPPGAGVAMRQTHDEPRHRGPGVEQGASVSNARSPRIRHRYAANVQPTAAARLAYGAAPILPVL